MSLNIGLDLCDDYITAYSYEDKVLVDVPAVICREKKDDLWYIGESAYRMALNGKGVLTDKLLSLLKKGGTSTIARKAYTAQQLLGSMISAVLWQLLNGRSPESIDRLVISLHTVEKPDMDSIIDAAEGSGIKRDRISIISHTDAFVYYTLSQSKELYANMTGLFDLSDEQLSFYKMKAVRGISRNSVVAECTDLEENFRIGILKKEAGSELGDRIMTDAAKRCLSGNIYSSVILTGKGFERTDWAKSFIEFVCRKRKVIYEKGLFAIGAAVCACHLSSGGAYPYLVFSDTSVTSEISVKVRLGEKNTRLVLIRSGQPWYNASAYAEVLLHEQDYIDIDIEPVDKNGVKRSARIMLDGFEKRPDRCTRVSIEIFMSSSDTMEITVRDMGFGDLFPASEAVVSEAVRL